MTTFVNTMEIFIVTETVMKRKMNEEQNFPALVSTGIIRYVTSLLQKHWKILKNRNS